MVRVATAHTAAPQGTTPQSRSARKQNANQFAAAPFRVLYDHRERTGGWRFTDLLADSKQQHRPLVVPTREVHLKTGDYTAELPDGTGIPVWVERKSHDDLIGSIAGGHKRFRAEHERMAELMAGGGHCCVIVESTLAAVLGELNHPESTRGASSELVLGITASWPARYGVTWHWAGDRATAEKLALKVIWKAWERMGG